MPTRPPTIARNAWARFALPTLQRRRAELRLAVRMAVGAIAAFALAELFGLAQGYWAVLTVVIVMQASVGGSLKAMVERLVGTLGGAVLGGALAAILPLDDPFMHAAGLAAAILPLAFIAAVDPRFRVAPLTAVIVLLSPTGPEISPILFTLERIGQIALGSAVALAVSLLVLPARAHNILAQATGRLVGLLADFFVLVLDGLSKPVDGAEVRRLQIATRRTIVQLETIAEEARRERASRLTDDPDPDPILRTSLRVRSDVIMLARAAREPLPAAVGERLQSAIGGVAASGGVWLRGLSEAFATRAPPPQLDNFDAALRTYRGEIAALRRAGTLHALPVEPVGRIFALGFALDQLRENAGDLADRAAEFARPRRAE